MMVRLCVADLKPGVFDAPLRGCRGLTSPMHRQLGIDAVVAKAACPSEGSIERVRRCLVNPVQTFSNKAVCCGMWDAFRQSCARTCSPKLTRAQANANHLLSVEAKVKKLAHVAEAGPVPMA
jgi:hypothetical protein